MNSKRFEYVHKDLSMLKKDILFRTIFGALFLAIFVWQFVMVVMDTITQSMITLKIISSVIVLISSLMMSLLSLIYIFKDFKIISVVKTRGKCVSSVSILIKTTKRSFIKLYDILMKVLLLIITLVLIASVTYTILQVSYLSFISFYMPVLFLICISGYNSIYHIKNEIKTQEMVQVYNGY